MRAESLRRLDILSQKRSADNNHHQLLEILQTKPSQDVKPVHAGHLQIQEHYVGKREEGPVCKRPGPVQIFDCGFTVTDDPNDRATWKSLREFPLKKKSIVLRIIDDQEFACRHLKCRSSAQENFSRNIFERSTDAQTNKA